MPKPIDQAKIVLLGAGKMGSAMAEGWLEQGVKPEHLTIADPHLDEARKRAYQARGVMLCGTPSAEAVRDADALVLAIKPQGFAEILPKFGTMIDKPLLVISIAAGQSVGSIRSLLGAQPVIVRTMPNTPAAIGAGITAALAPEGLSEKQASFTEQLLKASGELVWVKEEAHIDAVTAISGSGPAYFYHFSECLAEAGAALGLAPEVAQKLAAATLSGAGALLSAGEESPEQLRINVSSPGGTTVAALGVFMQDDALKDLVKRAAEAAFARAQALR